MRLQRYGSRGESLAWRGCWVRITIVRSMMVGLWVYSGAVAFTYLQQTLGLINRLAPQDYHRFHSPVRGKVGKMTMIDGEYYTVNPQAIRTMLDVYGENVRKVVPVESEEFGTVMTVWVGAMSEHISLPKDQS